MASQIADQAKEAIDANFNTNATSQVIKDMNENIQTQFTTIYDGKKCSPVPDSVPMQISCAGSNTYFLEDFINKVCLTPGSSEDESNGDFLECTYGGSGGSGGAKKAYCLCRSGVTKKMENATKPVFALAVTIAAVEFILLVLALASIFDDFCEKPDPKPLDFQAPVSLEELEGRLDESGEEAMKNVENRVVERSAVGKSTVTV